MIFIRSIMNKKSVFITGGSRGIGAACVREFSRAGYSVYFCYKNSSAAALALSGETGARAISCDVSSGSDVERAAEEIRASGGVSVIINNAGVSLVKLFSDTLESDWENVFDVNIKGMFLVTRAFIGDMIRNKYGRIINISSVWGAAGASCEVCYSASKAAVIGFTKALAKEEGPSGINVNCIAPGFIDTEMNAGLDAEARELFIEETPLTRVGRPEEIAKTALFLASEDAGFITGQVIGVDGGCGI